MPLKNTRMATIRAEIDALKHARILAENGNNFAATQGVLRRYDRAIDDLSGELREEQNA